MGFSRRPMAAIGALAPTIDDCSSSRVSPQFWKPVATSYSNFRAVVSGDSPLPPSKLSSNTEDSTSAKFGNIIIKVIYVYKHVPSGEIPGRVFAEFGRCIGIRRHCTVVIPEVK
ncbi:hypothetical protein AVEN_207937-1 [Araneus ventricosus]|uniref:Uncharacterized protein n=1 Tax=Araneus ventricosus TaxID=182803 RepID=A0A4Y2JFL9_ARAVE|nr:hypothetical protein AVEN_207937-1 [Araneus ventricosus]